MKYLAMDIGCLECGESSEVLGVFDTEAEAETECETWNAKGWRGGQHSYEVFELNL